MAEGKFSKPRAPRYEEDLTQVFTPMSDTDLLLSAIEPEVSPEEDFSIPESVFDETMYPPREPAIYQDDEDFQEESTSVSKNKRIIAISLCSVALVVLIGIIAGVAIFLNSSKDDGLILNNVTVAGVNIGGMTPEAAAAALRRATDMTYSVEDMVIRMPDKTITLSPADTGAKLDIDAVAEAAYDYGRTGTSRSVRRPGRNLSTATTPSLCCPI